MNQRPNHSRLKKFCDRVGIRGDIYAQCVCLSATNPRDMKAASDPVGPKNNQLLRYYGSKGIAIIACWGAHCEPKREGMVCEVIGKLVMCLGQPRMVARSIRCT
ncbi:DUF1643 domain-containing protein [Cyanobium sp. BA20m-p-22]|uniref:DUF1643 domain-containing protein n=1 Tax=Cyanobium sp. BA20m-p-22 TaxID=2823704 RepID=UPI0037C0826A|nr:DUF1643 domain-containing protein [Cyanobium sp. BA20m-p-22]